MDLLLCETGSRCSDCHWWTARGCSLLARLDAATEQLTAAARPTRAAPIPVMPAATAVA
ncbi:MAG TPA: hypothetical protein VM889_05335 [Candidatus Thermoplasmatota archaeon]|nr:hypothetical protein [Candidatus Thermoplasmatota archaeon]